MKGSSWSLQTLKGFPEQHKTELWVPHSNKRADEDEAELPRPPTQAGIEDTVRKVALEIAPGCNGIDKVAQPLDP